MNYRSIFSVSLMIGLILSIIIFAWYNDWIIINFPSKPSNQVVSLAHKTYKKKVKLFYTKNNKPYHEERELLWSSNIDDNTPLLIQAWLTYLEEEEVLHKKIILQTAAITSTKNELIVSFSQTPFDKESSALSKLTFIEDLLKTLNTNLSNSCNKIHFLVNYKPLQDPHLDFSLPWPITGFLHEYHQKKLERFYWPEKKNFIIMIDPAGDARTTGRTIGDIFERSITMHAAQELKKMLEEHLAKILPGLRIFLTRVPGETVEPLQNAAFANRLRVDLYISLHCYQTEQSNPHCALYHFSYDPVADELPTKVPGLFLYPYQQAHRNFFTISRDIAQAVYQQLQKHKGFLVIEPIQAFPYKPLIGIRAPALGIEMGLPKKDDWKLIINNITQALYHASVPAL
jgi:N-acetylmuramoyl-L-alanine amidase